MAFAKAFSKDRKQCLDQISIAAAIEVKAQLRELEEAAMSGNAGVVNILATRINSRLADEMAYKRNQQRSATDTVQICKVSKGARRYDRHA
jgi:hypothetical protein